MGRSQAELVEVQQGGRTKEKRGYHSDTPRTKVKTRLLQGVVRVKVGLRKLKRARARARPSTRGKFGKGVGTRNYRPCGAVEKKLEDRRKKKQERWCIRGCDAFGLVGASLARR